MEFLRAQTPSWHAWHSPLPHSNFKVLWLWDDLLYAGNVYYSYWLIIKGYWAYGEADKVRWNKQTEASDEEGQNGEQASQSPKKQNDRAQPVMHSCMTILRLIKMG